MKLVARCCSKFLDQQNDVASASKLAFPLGSWKSSHPQFFSSPNRMVPGVLWRSQLLLCQDCWQLLWWSVRQGTVLYDVGATVLMAISIEDLVVKCASHLTLPYIWFSHMTIRWYTMNLWETRSSDEAMYPFLKYFEMIHWMVGMGYDMMIPYDTFNVNLLAANPKKSIKQAAKLGVWSPLLDPMYRLISAVFSRSAVRAPHRFRSRSLEWFVWKC